MQRSNKLTGLLRKTVFQLPKVALALALTKRCKKNTTEFTKQEIRYDKSKACIADTTTLIVTILNIKELVSSLTLRLNLSVHSSQSAAETHG